MAGIPPKPSTKMPMEVVKNVVGNAKLGNTPVSSTSRPTVKVSNKKK